jgi:hypothetical protein
MKEKQQKLYQVLKVCIAFIWLFNGLVCKVFDFVPRHQQIIGRILGEDHARPLTVAIGISEIIMALWILTSTWPRINTIIQILIIAIMNLIEFFLAPDLLLWGKANAFFAILLILIIYCNEFYLNRKLQLQS